MQYTLMVNGLPGKMAEAVIEAAQSRGITVQPFSLTGDQTVEKSIKVGNQDIRLVKPSERNDVVDQMLKLSNNVIAIDYTHPTAVNQNAEFYTAKKIAFVMGTTGGDRVALKKLTDSSESSSVIAPNMGKQIVALQFMLEEMANNFPDMYKGYSLEVREAHQSHKADTSGTAKAIVTSFNKMGIEFAIEEIQKLRTEKEQLDFEVPKEYLSGHAFHTYTLRSPDKTVAFEFKHNVCGRKFYAEGTVDAAVFLGRKIEEGSETKAFNMMDVLRAGAMN